MRARRFLSLLVMSMAAVVFSAPAAPAQSVAPPPWCAMTYGPDGGYTSCDYQSYEQCRAAIGGIGGICHENPAGGRQRYEPGERRRSVR